MKITNKNGYTLDRLLVAIKPKSLVYNICKDLTDEDLNRKFTKQELFEIVHDPFLKEMDKEIKDQFFDTLVDYGLLETPNPKKKKLIFSDLCVEFCQAIRR